jgi:ArsR family metal-binding transcriptional regulator
MKPCRTATAFVSTLKQPSRVDLRQAADRLCGAGWRVHDVKVMLILDGEPELTLYESGKILVKTNDSGQAREAIDRVYQAIGLAAHA